MNKQPPFTESMPIDPLAVAANYFSLDGLETSFNLLRERHPALALSVQNLIASTRLGHPHSREEKVVPIDLDVELVSNIVTALSDIAETAANDKSHSQEHIITIHQTLLDWLLYAQSFLNEPDPLTIKLTREQLQ